jgi:hypothetical protein
LAIGGREVGGWSSRVAIGPPPVPLASRGEGRAKAPPSGGQWGPPLWPVWGAPFGQWVAGHGVAPLGRGGGEAGAPLAM